MTKFVALLRGIGPGNPNMRNDKLRGVFEDLGFNNVQSVISSGNIVFESDKTDTQSLEKLVEKALPERLGFNSTTIIRSREQLQRLVDADPFNGMKHGPGSYLLVTFFQHPAKIDFALPFQPEGKVYKFLDLIDDALCSTTDNTSVTTTDLMAWMEKRFGKQISSRTWLTINRILKKMDN